MEKNGDGRVETGERRGGAAAREWIDKLGARVYIREADIERVGW